MNDIIINVYERILQEQSCINLKDNLNALETLREKLLKCDQCKRLVEARREILGENHYPVLFKSSGLARIMLIGIAPGRLRFDRSQLTEKETCFKMGSGSILNRLFDDLYLIDSIFHITNIVKCHTPKNQKFEFEEFNKCISLFLKQEIEIVRPIMIIILGRQAEQCLKEYMMFNGIFYTYKYLPHPSAVMRNFISYDEYKEKFLSCLAEIKNENS